MKLRSLTVEAVRGFQKTVELDCDADIVIVSGTNGTGKTSLFDSLQWLLLGDIPRLKAVALKTGEDYVSNKYAPTPPFVAATLVSEASTATISRRGVGVPTHLGVEIDGDRLPDRDAQEWLNELLTVEGEAERSFRRMFMLQQDDIKEFLYAETKERYDFLAELAGVGDLQQLDQQLKSELKKLRDAARQRADKLQTERSRLEATRRNHDESRAIIGRHADLVATRGDASVSELRTLLGLPPSTPPAVAASEARERAALIEELLAAADENERIASGAAKRASRDSGSPDELEKSRKALYVAEQQLRGLLADADRLEAEASERSARQERRKQFAGLALQELGEVCPVCEQTYDREHAVEHLRSMLEDETAALESRRAAEAIRADSVALSREVSVLRARIVELEAQTAAAQEAQATVDRSRSAATQALARAASLLGLSDGSDGDSVRAALTALKQQVTAAESRLTASSSYESSSQRLPTLERELNIQETLVATLAAEARELEGRTARAESACQWLGDHIVEATAQVVRHTAPLVNELYARLDVHPTFRRFDFRSDRRYAHGHIRPWVYDDQLNVDGNAAQVLSSAQLNALAVCLFLGLNLSSTARLKTVMLDDPVQNMDDVNVLSLVDVLRVLRTRRQVIISTHDLDFAELLWRKLRPLNRNERTLWLQLANWTSAGPEVIHTARRSETESRLEIVPA